MRQYSLNIRHISSQIKAMLISNPKKKFMQVGMGFVGPHTREMCFKIQKNPNSLIPSHTLIDLVHNIQPNSPFAAFD